MAISDFFDMIAPISGMAVEAVLNGLWQGVALAALISLLMRAIPRNPGMRYSAWYACLIAMLLLPAVHLALRLRPAASVVSEFREAPPRTESGAGLLPVEVETMPRHIGPVLSVPASSATALVVGWAAITLLMGARLARSYRKLSRLKRNSTPLDDPQAGRWAGHLAACHTRRRFEVRSSDVVPLPMLAGLVRPAILFPQELVSKLSAEERFRICLHELAHIRRWDDWANLFQRIVEAAMFFHPAIRWVGKRLCFERELACDDWVVDVSGSARSYAACLVRLAEISTPGAHPLPALGSASNRKQIQRRVAMLLNAKGHDRPARSWTVFFSVILVCLAASAVAAGTNPVIVVEDPPVREVAPPSPPAPPEAPLPPAPPALMAAPAPPSEPQASATLEPDLAQAEQAREMTERIKTRQEEIRKLTEEIRKEVDSNLRAKTDEIRKLAGQIGEKVRASIQPQVRQISELARKIAQEQAVPEPDEEVLRKLQEEIRQHEAEIARIGEQEIKGLEEQIRDLERAMRPSEERIREFETRIREMEREMRDKEREVRRQRDRRVPPATPPPPPPPPPPPKR